MRATVSSSPDPLKQSSLAARLATDVAGDIMFDAFNRGRYATDASFYQIVPAGVCRAAHDR